MELAATLGVRGTAPSSCRTHGRAAALPHGSRTSPSSSLAVTQKGARPPPGAGQQPRTGRAGTGVMDALLTLPLRGVRQMRPKPGVKVAASHCCPAPSPAPSPGRAPARSHGVRELPTTTLHAPGGVPGQARQALRHGPLKTRLGQTGALPVPRASLRVPRGVAKHLLPRLPLSQRQGKEAPQSSPETCSLCPGQDCGRTHSLVGRSRDELWAMAPRESSGPGRWPRARWGQHPHCSAGAERLGPFMLAASSHATTQHAPSHGGGHPLATRPGDSPSGHADSAFALVSSNRC